MQTEHTHDKDEKKIENQQLRVKVKRKANDDMTAQPSKIIRTELHNFPDNNLETSAIKSAALSIYRARRKAHPVLPKSREEVHHALSAMDTTTYKHEDFLLENNLETGNVIFSCTSNLEFLVNYAEEIFVDGTFNSCPKFFCQLYTIHGLCNGLYIPLVYSLLPGKSEAIYNAMWKCVLDMCSARNLQLEVQTMHVDFEYQMLTVLKGIFLNAVIKCCRFHLGQAGWRKIQNLGLSTQYKSNSSEIGQWLKLSFGLHFVNPSDVEDAFINELMSVAPQDERCRVCRLLSG